MSPYIDLHTHSHLVRDDVVAVYNHLLNENTAYPEFPFSAGLHPWYADQIAMDVLSLILEKMAIHKNFIAFGETGLDKLCKVPDAIQQDVFKLHLVMATQYNKPAILHCVKAWDDLIQLSSGFRNTKIIHGYGGGTELTKRLLQEGFSFSIGKAILNPSSKLLGALQHIPVSHLFCETDNATVSIQAIYQFVAKALNKEETDLRDDLYKNYVRLIS